MKDGFYDGSNKNVDKEDGGGGGGERYVILNHDLPLFWKVSLKIISYCTKIS